MFDELKLPIQISVKSLAADKIKSFLKMLGIIIGVGAVILIMAVGAGAQSLIVAQVKGLGTDLVGILPGNSDEDGPPTSVYGIVITSLTYEDAMALKEKKNVPNIVDVVAYTKSVEVVSWKANSYSTNISGATAGYMNVEGGELEIGRFFDKEEETNLTRVVVLGSTVKKELFGDSSALGEKVKIKNHTYEVIGIMKERGTVAFQNYDDQVFIPIRTVQKLIAGVDHLGLLRARVDYEENVERAMEDMRITLRERHDIADQSGDSDDFSVRSAAQALEAITTVTNYLKYFLAFMGGISLLVGGIGIANIMLVSVRERTREIGLRKAIGANNNNIMSQFLVESITLTIVGGIIGILSGIVLAYIIAVGARLLGYDWDFVVSVSSILLGLGVSGVVGLISGVYPAYKASRLEPVEALRYE